MRIKQFIFLPLALFFLSLLSSCGAKKDVVKYVDNSSLSKQQFFKRLKKDEVKFETLQGKIRIELKTDDIDQGHTFTFRMRKDEIIWITAPLGLARAIITPKEVAFYDKINNQYYKGDFKILSNYLGKDLNFHNVQNLLIGKSLYEQNNKEVSFVESNGKYTLKGITPFKNLLSYSSSSLKLHNESLESVTDNSVLNIHYNSYQNIEGQDFPKELTVLAKNEDGIANIKVDLSSLSLNNELRFPFTIPDGFKELILNEN